MQWTSTKCIKKGNTYAKLLFCSFKNQFRFSIVLIAVIVVNSVGPVYTNPDIFEPPTFSFRIQKFPRPHVSRYFKSATFSFRIQTQSQHAPFARTLAIGCEVFNPIIKNHYVITGMNFSGIFFFTIQDKI